MSDASNGQVVRVCQASGAVVARHAVKVVGKVNGMPDVAQATADTDEVYGFALESAADNAAFRVCVHGACEALAGDTLALGTNGLLTTTSAGELKPYAYGDRLIAYFLIGKTAGGDAVIHDVIDIVINRAPIDTGV